MENNYGKANGPLDNLKPKAAFKAGLLAGLGVMFAIGFFVLLGMMLSDKDFSSDKKDNNDNVIVDNTVTDVDNGAVDTEISVAGLRDGDWVRGDKNAAVTIVEFSDIDCPFCTRFHDTMKQVMSDYSGDINWVYRHFPLTSLHPEAFKKAEAAECVGEQAGNDGFWTFLDNVFANNETLAGISDVAGSISGVNVSQFEECLDSGKYTSKVTSQSQEAQKAGARGTPYSVIIAGNQKVAIPGALPYDSIKTTLDALVK